MLRGTGQLHWLTDDDLMIHYVRVAAGMCNNSHVLLLQRIRVSKWTDLKVKGDPLRVPVCSYEVRWLVIPLVKLSQFLNGGLGLNQPHDPNLVAKVDWKVGTWLCLLDHTLVQHELWCRYGWQ